MSPREPLWKRIDRLQTAFGWSGRQLALECGISHQTLNRAKKRSEGDPGVSLRADSAEKIAARTHCDFHWLMTGAGDWGLRIIVEPARLREVEEGTAIARTLSPRPARAPTLPPKRLRAR